ncbi:hypothetical protein [Rhizobacter sp. Root16D2]|uniref:hypothetical protein n=1 Tax=Rhizobacter sp. Root16D2 TaxID=1736479 RepID=UPI0012F8FC59|nr:hypothetical protein [Rhizobacter sp. Root16D2]
MNWQWLAAAAAIRIIFLFAPLANAARDFALDADELAEAKEYSRTASCRAMLLSLPVLFFFSALGDTTVSCPSGVLQTPLLISISALFASGYLTVKIPVDILRGSVTPFALLVILTIADLLLQLYGKPPYIDFLCKGLVQ